MRAPAVLIALMALVPSLGVAQEYVMYETSYLTVMPGHTKPFSEAMKAHNDRFHASGPYQATVSVVSNGPRAGQMFWAMGPTTFTDLDGRPSGPDHLADWADNVLVHAEQGDVEYWRRDPELSHNDDAETPTPVLRARVFDLKGGEGDRFTELHSKLQAVRKAKNSSASVSFFRSVAMSGSGRDVAVVTNYDNWAALDAGGGSLVKDFEEVHGTGSWGNWIRDWNDVVENAQDEFHELIPELSGETTTSSE